MGAFSGLTIGLTREGAQFVASLGSVKGWTQVYTGSSRAKIKKIDNGDHLSKPPSRSGVLVNTITFDSLHKLILGIQLNRGNRLALDWLGSADSSCMQVRGRSNNFWARGLPSLRHLLHPRPTPTLRNSVVKALLQQLPRKLHPDFSLSISLHHRHSLL